MANNELLSSAKMIYEQVKNYDLHYSNIRTSVSTFLLTTALGLGSYLIGKGLYGLALIMPTAFLCISILNNLFFVYVMRKCAKKAGELEVLISALSQNKDDVKFKVGKKKKELSISDYIDQYQPLLFRTDFDQIIKDFDPLKNAPGSFFGEIGVQSTTILTILYFVFVGLMMIFSS